jgi:ligand-binding SRPBCC domain-containing protein
MQFVKESVIKAPPIKVFAFHERPDAFELLVPPWESVKIIQRADISEVGSRAIIEQKLFGFIKQRWIAEHTKYEPPRFFEDTQISGPFKKWIHQHIILEHKDGTILRDQIEFDPGYSFIGGLGAKLLILPKIEKMFEFRHRITKEYCE